nr:hypothetical protein Iba_chr12aCG9900 [Ipomoea batatas]GMD63503.1 hypothetical protein Iba_chr12bCG15490 [Ipomoea batatas]
MKKIACIALAAAAFMSVAMAPEAVAATTTPAAATHAPGHAIASDAFATLPIVGSVFEASLFFFVSYLLAVSRLGRTMLSNKETDMDENGFLPTLITNLQS